MTFHRPASLEDYLGVRFTSPSSGRSRGYCYAEYFSRDGTLVASASQEGVTRMREKEGNYYSAPK